MLESIISICGGLVMITLTTVLIVLAIEFIKLVIRGDRHGN